MTIAVSFGKIVDKNIVPIFRFLLMGVGVGSSWMLFFNFPSLGAFYDYCFGVNIYLLYRFENIHFKVLKFDSEIDKQLGIGISYDTHLNYVWVSL